MEIDWAKLFSEKVIGSGLSDNGVGPSKINCSKRDMEQKSRQPLRPIEPRPATLEVDSGSNTSFGLSPSSPLYMSTSPFQADDGLNVGTVKSASGSNGPRNKKARMRSTSMHVKVLYTLESNPQETLVANSITPAHVNLIPLRSKGGYNDNVASSWFGKVSLKACLESICTASPELVMRRDKDFILYAQDPIESFRASLRRLREENPQDKDGIPKICAAESSSSSGSAAFMVGKGFLSHALTEPGNGLVMIHGRVRSEYDEEEDEGDENFDFEGKVLEVNLRLKEAPNLEHKQHYGEFMQTKRPSVDTSDIILHSNKASFPSENKQNAYEAHSKERNSAPKREESISSTDNGVQQQLLQLLQALQEPRDSDDSSFKSEKPRRLKSEDSEASPTKSTPKHDMIETLLHTLTTNTPSELHSTPRGKALELGRSSPTNNPAKSKPVLAASPILGGLTPGYELNYLRNSPTSSAAPTPQTQQGKLTPSTSRVTLQQGEIDEEELPSTPIDERCCYNCGLRSQRTWRHLHLPDNADVRFPEGSATIMEGKKVHRSCNACGIYYFKYDGFSRPEHVWNRHEKMKTSEPTKQGWSEKFSKTQRSALARTLSEACAREVERRGSSRKADVYLAGIEAIEAAMGKHHRVRKSIPSRKNPDFESARMKDLTLDRHGKWRTKRSILENPEGLKPGRPKGRKTGEALGRNRQLKIEGSHRNESHFQSPLNATVELTNGRVSASSPPRNIGWAKHHAVATVSSPVRSVVSTVARPQKTPLNLAKNRYGAPTHLLNSSPATAFQTVMDEADTDWKALYGMSPRRSPRKNPSGVHNTINPYATALNTSPLRRDDNMLGSSDLLKMTSSSPLTRNRVKSGQFEWNWTSSDGLGSRKKAMSSVITSPLSPSPRQSRGTKRKSNQLQPGPSSNASHQSEQSLLGSGPFMGLDSTDDFGDDVEDPGEPGSPTLGRSRRLDKKKRVASGVAQADDPGAVSIMSGGLDQHASVLDAPDDWIRSTSMRELFPTPSPGKKWIQSPSQDIWGSPLAWELVKPSPSPAKKEAGQSKKSPRKPDTDEQRCSTSVSEVDQSISKPEPTNSHQLVHRKPLPATVEDASPSEITDNSPPEEDDDDDDCALEIDPNDESSMTALMGLLEDPYGLLQASGLSIPANHDKAIDTQDNDTLDRKPRLSGSANGFSVEQLAQVELFNEIEFDQQLAFFTNDGSSGVAAHVDPSSQEQSKRPNLKIENNTVP